MRNSTRAVWILVAVAVLACDAFAAPPDDLEALLRRLPPDCVAIAGSADASAGLAPLQPWVPMLAARAGDKLKGLTDPQFVAAAAGMLDGPAVAGLSAERTVFLLAGIDKTQPDVLTALDNLSIDHSLDGDTIVLAPDGPIGGLIRVQGGLLGYAADRELLDRILAVPDADAPSILDSPDGVALLRLDELQAASAFAFKTGWAPEILSDSATGAEALLRRGAHAVARTLRLDAPLVLRLHVGRAGTRIGFAARLPRAEPLGEAGRLFALPDACPEKGWGWMHSMADLADLHEDFLAAFDPDVAAEFREEMAEVNADLGYDFRQEFLGNLGPGWARAVLPAQDGGLSEWFWAYGVQDSGKLIRQAEALARFAAEPWEETASEGPVRRFSTRAFTIPLELAVDEHLALLAPSSDALHRALALARESEAIEPQTGIVWESHSIAPLEESTGPRMIMDARRLAERVEVELLLEGLGPQQLGAALLPVSMMLR